MRGGGGGGGGQGGIFIVIFSSFPPFFTSSVVGRRVLVLSSGCLASYVGQSEVPALITSLFSPFKTQCVPAPLTIVVNDERCILCFFLLPFFCTLKMWVGHIRCKPRNGCRTAWLGFTPGAPFVQRYTVRRGLLYFKISFWYI